MEEKILAKSVRGNKTAIICSILILIGIILFAYGYSTMDSYDKRSVLGLDLNNLEVGVVTADDLKVAVLIGAEHACALHLGLGQFDGLLAHVDFHFCFLSAVFAAIASVATLIFFIFEGVFCFPLCDLSIA